MYAQNRLEELNTVSQDIFSNFIC